MTEASINNSNNFAKICRTCLTESTKLHSIFENSLHETIMACVSVKVCYCQIFLRIIVAYV